MYITDRKIDEGVIVKRGDATFILKVLKVTPSMVKFGWVAPGFDLHRATEEEVEQAIEILETPKKDPLKS